MPSQEPKAPKKALIAKVTGSKGFSSYVRVCLILGGIVFAAKFAAFNAGLIPSLSYAAIVAGVGLAVLCVWRALHTLGVIDWIGRHSPLRRLPKTIAIVLIAFVLFTILLIVSVFVLYLIDRDPSEPHVTSSDFKEMVEQKRILDSKSGPDIILNKKPKIMRGDRAIAFFIDSADGQKKWVFFDNAPPAIPPMTPEWWIDSRGYNVEIQDSFPLSSVLMQTFQGFAMTVPVFFLFWIFMGGGMRSMGSSFNALREDTLQKRPPVYFTDIGGMEEAKREAREIIEFLKNREEFKKSGLKMPKGILIEGPSGVGKTYFATAVATEAGYPAFLTSGSSFRKPLIGLGPDEVKRWFDRLKRNMPCVGILDEADSALSSRAQRSAVESSEMAAITNTFLTEIEDIEKRDLPILIIALTNLGLQIDEAAKRSGRFDKKITARLPHKEERKETVKIYLGLTESKVAPPVTLDPEITDIPRFLDEVAKIIAGFTGADIANLINQSRTRVVFERIHGKRESDFLTRRDILATIPKILSGSSATELPLSAEEKIRTRWHEAAHTYLSWLLKHAVRAEFVVAQPHGDNLGVTMTPTEQHNFTSSNFVARIKVGFGGYIIEKIEFGEHDTGSWKDLENLNNIARDMVYKYGMSRLGPVTIARVGQSPQGGQVETTEEGEKEVRRIISECEEEALEILVKDGAHYLQVKKLVDALAACADPQMLVGSEIEKILGPIEQI